MGKNSSLIYRASLLGLALSCLSATSWAQDAPAVSADGYFDFYFQNDSLKAPANGSLAGRAFDIKHNRYSVAVGQLGFSKAATHKDAGFTLQFFGGKNADLISLGEPGGSKAYKFIRQAFVTWQLGSEASPWTFDLGKFDTPIGYEGIDNRFQDNYSRSFNWSFSQPVYHTGLRASHAFSPKLSSLFYVVSGWNEVEDANGRPGVGVGLTYQPNVKLSVTLNQYLGREGSDTANDAGVFGGLALPSAGAQTLSMTDFIATYLPDDKQKFVLNADYGTTKNGGAGGSWNGVDVYYRRQLNSTKAFALRLDHMDDVSGLRTGAPVKLDSLTGTFDWNYRSNLTFRFEVRADRANTNFFNDADGNFRKNRTTLTFAQIYKF